MKALRNKNTGRMYPWAQSLVNDSHLEEVVIVGNKAVPTDTPNATGYPLVGNQLKVYGEEVPPSSTPTRKASKKKAVRKKTAKPVAEPAAEPAVAPDVDASSEGSFGVDDL